MPDITEANKVDGLKTLNRRRGNLKSRITKLFTFLSESALAADKYKLQSKLDCVRDIALELKELKCCCYELVDDEHLSDVDSQFEFMEENLEDIKVSLQKCLFKLDEHNCSNLSGNNKTNSNSIKLPNVSLPEFCGDIENWPCFKVQFDSLITNNSSLTDLQKLFYLRSALKGEVVHIETPEDTFNSLRNVLIDRYENKRLIVNAHVQNILNMENLTCESAKLLRNILDVLNKNLRGLKLLELETNELTQQFLMNIIVQKLDKDTRKMYEMSLTSNEIPNWEYFLEFIEKRSQVLENLKGITSSSVKVKVIPSKTRNFMIKANNYICVLCKKSHAIYGCTTFLKLNPLQRFDVVKKHKLCLNCLNDSHKLASCTSSYSCRVCQGKHNYLLCRNQNNKLTNGKIVSKGLVQNLKVIENSTCEAPHSDKLDVSESSSDKEQVVHTLSSLQNSSRKSILLFTAIVWVWSPQQNSYIPGRVILDSGSQCHLITSRFASKLGLVKQRVNMPISGLGGSTTNVKWKVNSLICNENSSFSALAEFLVVEKIVDYVPSSAIDIRQISIPKRSMLADPCFDKPGKVDMIIGVELFFQIVKDGKLRVSEALMFQNSVFGLIASGSVVSKNPKAFCGLISQADTLDHSLRKFWELEEVSFNRPLSRESEFCELHFQETHKRDDVGRFVVEMPVREEKLHFLGDSRFLAEKRLQQTVRRLNKNPEMYRLYLEFLNEYESLNHMERISSEQSTMVEYFLPHHGVYKPENSSTKLRVVFNASASTTSGLSLNDLLLTGEVREDIFDIMIRFRKHKIVLTADIKQMFRQILVDPTQRNLLKILWKTQESHSPIVYRLNTVTYGTKCAPFLATRVIKQLALDESTKFPLASRVALSDIYMDDIVTGCQDVESARLLKDQLISMFQTCSMTLHKWNSNCEELLENEGQSLIAQPFAEISDTTVKTLGMVWKSFEDKFVYKVSVKSQSMYTKREVLSTIAKLYDPFGLLGPVICKAKIFLQRLWLQKLDWDEELPQSIATDWNNSVGSLPEIENITINRYILMDAVRDVALFGFCDASLSAYGAVAYLICYSSSGNHTSKLLASKSRVAPLKTLSIPRLELCSCLLLSKLVYKILVCLDMNIDKVVLHSDSTIALAWIRSPIHRLKTFVGNRVSKIQLLTENYQWRHITSANNPADILSRGISPSQLKAVNLWWTGPALADGMDVLEETQLDYPDKEHYLLELKEFSNVNLSLMSNVEFINLFLSVSNSYLKLIRILSFICRFCNNARNPSSKLNGPLFSHELHNATLILVRCIQEQEFGVDINNLGKGKILTGRIRNLNPFLDKNRILRVGGRLQNSQVSISARHPIILPSNHKFTKCIVVHFHEKYLHIGPQNLLYCVRREFWPLNGRNLCRKVVYNCITCFRTKPRIAEQIMGSLPKERVNIEFAFNCTGLDFCGPFLIKYKGQRKGIFHKIYVCIFICMVTKALHLEIVSDLTTEAFIATLKRFFARRGKSQKLFSDNASNFVGADSELRKLYKLVTSPESNLVDYLSSESIKWQFIPPRSPNFGGLWEAGVKAFKYHFKRVVGNAKLTYEEFLTILCQIEGILNSRPLTPLSGDIDDLEVLTPAHFLVGRPLTAIPEPNLKDIKDNRLNVWQRTTKMVQIIWKRWQNNYLNTLQQRHKWMIEKENIKIGDMVVVKEDNLPCCKWSLGRVLETYFGEDKKVRVVAVKTTNGTYKRPISKVAVLPLEN